MPSAMDLGIADHRERAGREQATQIAVAFADVANGLHKQPIVLGP